jgi:uncharacterized membrane protein YesL
MKEKIIIIVLVEFIGLILCINAHLICYMLEIPFSIMTYVAVLLVVLWCGILALFVFMPLVDWVLKKIES